MGYTKTVGTKVKFKTLILKAADGPYISGNTTDDGEVGTIVTVLARHNTDHRFDLFKVELQDGRNLNAQAHCLTVVEACDLRVANKKECKMKKENNKPISSTELFFIAKAAKEQIAAEKMAAEVAFINQKTAHTIELLQDLLTKEAWKGQFKVFYSFIFDNIGSTNEAIRDGVVDYFRKNGFFVDCEGMRIVIFIVEKPGMLPPPSQ